MQGRVCLITGATSGIGAVTAEALAGKGAAVVIVSRNLKRCADTADRIKKQTGNNKVDYMVADLSSLNEIRRLAKEFRTRHARLDVLINNAGGVFLKRETTVDGIEMTFALNHLGYFLLTNLLLGMLKENAPARIVSVSSVAHLGTRLDFSNLQIAGWEGYKRSKLANLLFTYELARRLEGSRVTANALHPGLVASNFGMNNRGLFRLAKPLINLFSISNEQGARTSIFLASSPEVEGVSGRYFVKCAPQRSSEASYDREAAGKLWEVSARMTGI